MANSVFYATGRRKEAVRPKGPWREIGHGETPRMPASNGEKRLTRHPLPSGEGTARREEGFKPQFEEAIVEGAASPELNAGRRRTSL